MNFLRNLFSGSTSNGQDADDGIYIYVRPQGCEEVIQVRLNPRNDLTHQDGGGYFVKKTARGNYRCFNPVEMTLHFDDSRKLVNHDVSGGDLVDAATYKAWEAKLAERKRTVSAPAEE